MFQLGNTTGGGLSVLAMAACAACGVARQSPVGSAAMPSEMGASAAYALEEAPPSMPFEESAAPPPPSPSRMDLSEARAEAAGPTQPSPGPRPPSRGEAASAEPATSAGSATAGASAAPRPRGPLLIYEAFLNLAVHEVREKMERAVAVVDAAGGFLARQDDTTVVVRVPAARFRETLREIESIGDVLHRRIMAQDVTEQVRDMEIRLRNALQMRDQLAALLARAQTVPDSLAIERELERLTQTVELLRGQLRSLEDRIAFSTITVQFEPIRVDEEVPRERFRLPFEWLNRLGLARLLELGQ